MATKPNYSRFVSSRLSERQIKSFTTMYKCLDYSTSDIAKRFEISTATVTQVAKDLDLEVRKPIRGAK